MCENRGTRWLQKILLRANMIAPYNKRMHSDFVARCARNKAGDARRYMA